ncbi:hypothetical protein HanXRQr2_Chr15g0719491 [Helianthus annuus]|uniref:Uncharacterized protein n=1 Tax=Helianthus annuus TaxID=4232 RepID=A0A9K3H475_HELAN|nr:hypothetical protein HanXRQr2_Chr15g0719491 [Helianthus annuus]KAJ0833423.1 hypothetical protein HanPSC8_Chr15g0690201 [Helianthus annuus]
MRTRFLTDVFNSSAASNRLQTLDFLRFPPPELPSADQFIFNSISCFDQLNFITLAPEIDTISVNESLCKFLSDVLPQAVSTEIDRQIVTEVASERLETRNVEFRVVVMKIVCYDIWCNR